MVRTVLLANARPDDVDSVELNVRPGSFVLSPRSVFDPASTGPRFVFADDRTPATRGRLKAVLEFYRDPLAVLGYAVSALVLIYLGGAAMFWYHAVQLGEGGPAISWYAHWLLDSTFGFLGLTPVLLLIMPLAVAAATRAGAVAPRAVPWIYSGIAGLLFAFATVPGPLAHDMFVGRGTWIATKVTNAIGDPSQALTPVAEYSAIEAMALQLGAAVPLYIVLSAVSVFAVRGLVTMRRKRAPAVAQ